MCSTRGILEGRDQVEQSRSRIRRQKALEAVEKLELATWRYKPELGLGLESHAGPMAEDMKGLGLSDGQTVQPMDTAGLGLAAVKDLARKVGRIEHSLGLRKAA